MVLRLNHTIYKAKLAQVVKLYDFRLKNRGQDSALLVRASIEYQKGC